MSVVICAYTEHRWNNLLEAVEAVRRQTVSAGEIIVVVDHNPALLERVRQAMPDVVAIENHEARGLGGARNSGVAAARGQVVVFLDDDALPEPDWLASMQSAYANPDVVGVGGAIEPIWEAGRPAWLPEEFYWVVGCTYRGLPETTTPVRNLIGCNMSFRREIFSEVGLFRLGYGCDETEFCIRVGQRWPSRQMIYEPKARVGHHVTAARSTWAYFRTRCYFEGGSKAVVSWIAGPKDGLASERNYTMRVLPLGIVRGMLETISGRDRAGIARSGAIIAGLAATVAGYVAGRLFTAQAAQKRGWKQQTA